MNEILSVSQIAHELGVSPQTIYKWERAGKFATVYKFGGRWKIYRSDYEAWKRSHIQPSVEGRRRVMVDGYQQFSVSAEKNGEYTALTPDTYARVIGAGTRAIWKQIELRTIDFFCLQGKICIPIKKEVWEEFISEYENLYSLGQPNPLDGCLTSKIDLSESSQSSELS